MVSEQRKGNHFNYPTRKPNTGMTLIKNMFDQKVTITITQQQLYTLLKII